MALSPKEIIETMMAADQMSQWLGPSPEELGVPKQVKGNQVSPIISSRNLKFGT